MLHVDPKKLSPAKGLEQLRRLGRPVSDHSTETAAHVRTAGQAMAIAFVLVFLFGSEGIRHVARDLPGNQVTDRVVWVADHWHALMLELGPAHIRPAIREAFLRLRAMTW